MAEAGYQAAERLGRLAQEETGYGVALHKKLKNEFSSRMVWNSLRDMKTVGVIRHDPERRLGAHGSGNDPAGDRGSHEDPNEPRL